MSINRNLPSYQELFGQLNFKKGDEARSVYSPSAYLADLLQLMDDHFENADLDNRRGDVKKLTLNGENSYELIPYLDIVNQVLEEIVGTNPYETLKNAQYPFNLPFDLQQERVKKHLQFLAAKPTKLYKLFATNVDPAIACRSYLGLTEADYNFSIAKTDEAEIKAQYNLLPTEPWTTILPVEKFMEATALTGKEVRELLFGNLSESAKDIALEAERTIASTKFTNAQLGDFVTLDQAEENLIWDQQLGQETTWTTWFERVNRLVRLAKKIGISIADFDNVLRLCCDNQLDENALHRVAIIKQFHDKYGLDFDQACSLFQELNLMGIGDEKTPQDLFNKIYNLKWADLEEQYIPAADFVPADYADYEQLTCVGDILLEQNKPFRDRISKSLHLSTKDLTLVIERFRARSKDDDAYTSSLDNEVALSGLSLLYRLSKLVEILDTSYTEILDLLDILEQDAAIREYNNFDLLVATAAAEWNTYAIIEGDDFTAKAWLIQLICSVTEWAQQQDLTFEELKQMLSGTLKDKEAEEAHDKAQIAVFNNIYQQFKTTLHQAVMFESDRFDPRTAKRIHQNLENSTLVSPLDSRILSYDEAAAKELAYTAINQIATLNKADFAQLGISEKMLDKLYNNLILYGYLNLDGTLREEDFPKESKDFQVAADFTTEQKPVFAFLHDLYKKAAERGEEPKEFSFYPSDLRDIERSDLEKLELYDNLIFNEYLDKEGRVLDVEFFADSQNEQKIELNSNLISLAVPIFEKISERKLQLAENKLPLQANIFEALPLKEKELEELIENLQFNDYLDEDKNVLDKVELLDLEIRDFNIALQFYPHRRKILAAIQQAIQAFKDNLFTLKKEDLTTLADELVAELLFEKLTKDYFPDGKFTESQSNFFEDTDQLKQFEIGSYFTENYRQIIFKSLGEIVGNIRRYQFGPSHINELKFTDEEYQEMLGLLEKDGFLMDSQIPANKLDYFLNINNALDFEVERFEDYDKDIFFVLHNIAKEMDEGLKEISLKIKELTESQTGVVFNALQDALALDTPVLKVVCREVFGKQTPVEAIMAPLFKTVDKNDSIAEMPLNHKFKVAYQRIEQFALLSTKLALTEDEVEVVFTDQGLVGKFPENLNLPEGIDSFDALLENLDGLIYIFKDDKYWTWSAENYNVEEENISLSKLSDSFAALTAVDAAFMDKKGNAWLIAGTEYFCKEEGKENWAKKERTWGRVDNEFTDPKKVTAALQDHEGKSYLFAQDQYIRYSGDFTNVDEGYPKTIKGNWKNELDFPALPSCYHDSIDASFQGLDDKTYLFKNRKFVSSDDFSKQLDSTTFWGKIKEQFDATKPLDAAFAQDDKIFVFSGEQVYSYTNNIENQEIYVDEGFPKTFSTFLPGLPEEFTHGVDAIFKGTDGKIHCIKNEHYLSINADLTFAAPIPLAEKWGKIKNNIAVEGTINAAFTGLDGRTYIFSGDQYFRYSHRDYSKVDEGYPRTIEGNWGGLNQVDAAFILDGKTYLFGQYLTADQSSEIGYVCYLTNDYSLLEDGYPKKPNDNWWNLPFKLVENGFSTPDSVFIGKNGNTYLFSGTEYVYFEKNQRWWSEPMPLVDTWDSIPFEQVDAAFTGKDGRTYLFSGEDFIRYSDKNFNKIDDRFPKKIEQYWGNVVNNIERSETIDAAIVVESRETEEINDVETEITTQHTYLFSGNQFFRYKGTNYDLVEEGYPKYLKNLKNEPRFANFEINLEHGIDAAFADQRTVYLFKDDKIHLGSDSQHKIYDNIIPQQILSAFMDEGKLYLEDGNGWKHYSSLEGNTVSNKSANPAILREAQPDFKEDLDAVLKGIDNNTYLFKGNECYNLLLDKKYPLNEEWGRAAVNVQVDNSIDAIFEGLDGKVYIFSADQYLTYTMPKAPDAIQIPAFVDAYPKKISDDFGGLENVALAFVKEGKTYLFEKADAYGNQRFICFSTADYTKADSNYAETTTIAWWGMPELYIEDGFDRIDAVIFDEEDNLFLIKENKFVQYNSAEKHWSYPKPLERIWRGLPYNNDNFETIKTAFSASDGRTYFFSKEAFVTYKDETFTTIQEIKDRWGMMDNNIVQNQKIDAAFVFGKNTYLFSGDQYVRYSGFNYEFIDEGFPKDTLKNLRLEEGFQALPDSFETELESLFEAGNILDAIVATKRTIFIFAQNKIHVASSELTHSYELNQLGRIRNNIKNTGRIDAALVTENGDSLLFSGDQFFRYSGKDYEFVDEGYPKSIEGNLATEENIGQLPPAFHFNLDAALRGENGAIYLFKDKDYYDSNQANSILAISDKWGKVNNNFHQPGEKDNISLNSLFIAPNGSTYAFKDDQYIRYADFDNEYVDEGFPKTIKDNWGNMPPNFETGIEGAFTFEGKTYLAKGDSYIRYSDWTYAMMDPIFPQKFVDRWGHWADYLLTDFKAIFRYKEFIETHGGGDYSLTDMLNEKAGYKEEPYLILATIFDWDIDEVKWLKRNNAFLADQGALETRFNLELVSRIYDIFQLTDKMGANPSEVYEAVWRNLFPETDLEKAADTLYKFIGWVNNSAEDWAAISKQLHDEMNELKRDALVPYIVAQDAEVDNARDLYGKLLIDVEMGSCATTSKVKEALAAVQLYFHRYFVNLELIDIKEATSDTARKQLKEQWQWMKNYRVWEANRKVFLYPENYIRPELRDNKTPAFQTLEDDLMQGEMTDDLASQAYRKYLDEYTEVSRLTIAGGYTYEAPDNESNLNLVLFGRTKTEPYLYYYRNASFLGGATNAARWEPWIPVETQIEAARVYPVYAFGRIFVFWGKVTQTVGTSASTNMTVTTSGSTQTVSNNAPVTYTLEVYFTFYDLNKKWKAPQLLDTYISTSAEAIAENFELYVENAEKVEGDEHENIIVNCRYMTYPQGLSNQPLETQEDAGTYREKSYYLTPELYTIDNTNTSGFDNPGLSIFNGIFPNENMTAKRLVMFNTFKNSADAPWFSFDHKGGSFLVKPSSLSLDASHRPTDLTDNDDLPNWNKIDAAFHHNNTSYFFNKDNKVFTKSSALDVEEAISSRWGNISTNLRRTGIVDAAFTDGNRTFLFSGDEYLVYSDQYEAADRGNPSEIVNNNRFPSNITAAMKLDGLDYFFQGNEFVTSADLSNPKDLSSKWLIENTTLSFITAAFVHGNHTYLISNDKYIRFEGTDARQMDPGYPKVNNLFNLLEDLGCTNNDVIYQQEGVYATLDQDGEVFFYGIEKYKFSGLEVEVMSVNEPSYALFAKGSTIYRFMEDELITTNGSSQNTRSIARDINAAFLGLDDQVYLLSGEEFISFPSNGLNANTIVDKIQDWENPTQNEDHWGRQEWRPNNPITAAFQDGQEVYLFKGDEYCVFSNGNNIADVDYPKNISNLLGSASDWDSIDAAFKGIDGKRYFFNNAQQKFTSDDNPLLVQDSKQWGIVENALVENGVDAAYEVNNRLILLSKNELYQYTIPANNEIGEFVDEGYPKTFSSNTADFIDAAYSFEGKNYFFYQGRYIKKDEGEELNSLAGNKLIKGNWGNLRPELIDGFDASMVTDAAIYFFVGNRYIRYAVGLDGAPTALPYEVDEAKFDIIRLTASTGAKLNQRLFLGGVDLLLNLETQEIDESPKFLELTSDDDISVENTAPSYIKYENERVVIKPVSSHLDFNSANGIYYWEVFFHTPYLIAQAFNTAQRFDEAKRWFEFIYDPTEAPNYWKFLPFLSVDINAIMDKGRNHLGEISTLPTNLSTDFNDLFSSLTPLIPVFQGDEPATEDNIDLLLTLENQTSRIAALVNLGELEEKEEKEKQSLIELLGIIETLHAKWSLLQNSEAQIQTYLDDPFDPHAIASLRIIGYQKAIVMAYVDNLLDWGDLLFRQYTMESINEARMLYVLAYDLLGRKPESLGTKILTEDRAYEDLFNTDDNYDFLLFENAAPAATSLVATEVEEEENLNFAGIIHDSILNNSYFFIPENALFLDYWDRVEDRLYKIRHCLNILGIKQPLPLFQPPIDPMALVRAASGGGGFAGAMSSFHVAIPHYRFNFMMTKVRELIQQLNQFGGDLLVALEKKDGEALTILQTKQEGELLSMQEDIRTAQLGEAQANIRYLEESRRSAEERRDNYKGLMDAGMSPWEITQLVLMGIGSGLMIGSSVMKIMAGVAHAFPKALLGPFIMGTSYGGEDAGNVFSDIGDSLETMGDGVSMSGDAVGIKASYERMREDWVLQHKIAISEITQITAQLEGAQFQELVAKYEIQILDKQRDQNETVDTFLKEKFTNKALYQWMAGKLSGLYFQNYKIAFDLAKQTEKAFQFERGLKRSEVDFINSPYWDSQRKGLLAGESLSLDVNKMEQAFLKTNSRRFEITKPISLLELDPLALLKLKTKGVCEFRLSEALFDYDFQGHYCRQIKSLKVTFDIELANGKVLFATLTQLSNSTVMEADAKAVKFLLDPKDNAPLSIRNDWRPSQQIALSREEDSGMFDPYYADDRYLHFEGTGAVSTWRLELNGKKGDYDASQLNDVTISLDYTALQGGEAFANTVKGLLKPYPTTVLFNFAEQFPREWKTFKAVDSKELKVRLTREMFPNMSSSKITAIYSQFSQQNEGKISFTLNEAEELVLNQGKLLFSTGLKISSRGSDWVLKLKGDKANLDNMTLVLAYMAAVK